MSMETEPMTSPLWQPNLVEDPAVVAEIAALYTGRSRAFVVYKSGTIVFSDSSVPRPDGDYDATLLNAVKDPPNFEVQEMRHGNFLIRFRGPVTALVLGDFYKQHEDEIRNGIEQDALLPGEAVLAGTKSWVPQEHYYAGLYARSKLFVDVETMQIAVRFVP